MDFSQIGELLMQFLDVYGVSSTIIVVLSILLIKIAFKFIDIAGARIKGGQPIFPTTPSPRQIRKDSVFKINRIITELMQKTNADHAALFEYHNGGYNLTGMPFLHFSLSIQRNNLGVEELSKDFDNVLVSSVPDFIKNVDCNDIYYVNDIKTLEPIFPRMYRELKQDDMSEAFFACIEGLDDEVGFLMLSFKDPTGPRKKKVQKELFKKIQKISTLLDLKKIK